VTKRPRPEYLAKRQLQPLEPRNTVRTFDRPATPRAMDDDLGLVEAGSNPTETETSLVRSSALVAVGTMLSRVTGFAPIAASACALGASSSSVSWYFTKSGTRVAVSTPPSSSS